MVSFDLGKELRKMFFHLMSQAWDKEKIMSPHEELNLRPLDLHSDALPLSQRLFVVDLAHRKVSVAQW